MRKRKLKFYCGSNVMDTMVLKRKTDAEKANDACEKHVR